MNKKFFYLLYFVFCFGGLLAASVDKKESSISAITTRYLKQNNITFNNDKERNDYFDALASFAEKGPGIYEHWLSKLSPAEKTNFLQYQAYSFTAQLDSLLAQHRSEGNNVQTSVSDSVLNKYFEVLNKLQKLKSPGYETYFNKLSPAQKTDYQSIEIVKANNYIQ